MVIYNDEQECMFMKSIKGKLTFLLQKGKKHFRLLLKPYFYVPQINGKRNYNLENWFSGVENTLAIFIKKLTDNFEGPIPTEKDFTKLLLALFSLKNRNKYALINSSCEIINREY